MITWRWSTRKCQDHWKGGRWCKPHLVSSLCMKKRCSDFKVILTSLLPLLHDKTLSVVTYYMSWDNIKETMAWLKFLALLINQFAVAKQILWHCPSSMVKTSLSISGGLHIEIATLKSSGNLFKIQWMSRSISWCSWGRNSLYWNGRIILVGFKHHQNSPNVTSCSLYKTFNTASNDYYAEAYQHADESLNS